MRECVNENNWSGISVMDTWYFLMIPLVLSAAGEVQVRRMEVEESTATWMDLGAAVGATRRKQEGETFC